MAFLGLGGSDRDARLAVMQQAQLQEQQRQQAMLLQQQEAERVAREAAAAEAERVRLANEAAALEARRATETQATQARTDAEARAREEAAKAQDERLRTARTFLATSLGNEGIAADNPAYKEIESYFNTKLNTNPLGDPTEYFTDARNFAEVNARKRYGRAIDEKLPTGFEKSRFADTLDDPILDSILTSQFGSASEAVERAKSRGQLNDTGYTAALAGLNDARTKGRARLQDVGSGVLNTYRDALKTEEGALRSRAANLPLGSNFDVASGIQGIDTRANDYLGRLEGDVRSAVGDQNFFDLEALLGKAGSVQGFVNSGGSLGGHSPLAAAFKPVGETKNKRTQGNVGVF